MCDNPILENNKIATFVSDIAILTVRNTTEEATNPKSNTYMDRKRQYQIKRDQNHMQTHI